jgi:hypothetical protein
MPHLLSAIRVENDQIDWRLKIKKDNEARIFNLALEILTNNLPVGPPRRPLRAGWIDCRDYEEGVTPLWQKNLDRNFWFEVIPEKKILFVQFNRVVEPKKGEFDSFVKNLPPQSDSLARLVIDLRTNRGGDATLLRPFIHYLIKHWSYFEPCSIFVLTSNYTFSAVHLAAEIEKNTHAIFVGEETAAPPNHQGKSAPRLHPLRFSKLFHSSNFYY